MAGRLAFAGLSAVGEQKSEEGVYASLRKNPRRTNPSRAIKLSQTSVGRIKVRQINDRHR